LQVAPERIDWLLAPLIEPSEEAGEELPPTPPSAGPFTEALSSFLKLAIQWLQGCPPVTRLAFGAILFQPTVDRRAGHVQLSKYLHSIDLDPDTSDFFYQINRPRNSTSGISGLRINRLTKWSVIMFQHFSVTLGKATITTAGYTTQEAACRVELDINTAPDFPDVLPHETLPKIFQELVDLGQEITAKGDIP
jgi:hypothetical protein